MVVAVEVVVSASEVEWMDLGFHHHRQVRMGCYSYTPSVGLEAFVAVASSTFVVVVVAVASVAAASTLAAVSLAPSSSVDAYTLPVVAAASSAAA